MEPILNGQFRRLLTSLAFVFLLLASQSVALLHNIVHPFHEHTELCELFEAQSLPAHLVSDNPFVLPLIYWQHPPATTLISRYLIAPVYFDAQAPPLFFSFSHAIAFLR